MERDHSNKRLPLNVCTQHVWLMLIVNWRLYKLDIRKVFENGMQKRHWSESDFTLNNT
jgi:hypothetical protein